MSMSLHKAKTTLCWLSGINKLEQHSDLIFIHTLVKLKIDI